MLVGVPYVGLTVTKTIRVLKKGHLVLPCSNVPTFFCESQPFPLLEVVLNAPVFWIPNLQLRIYPEGCTRYVSQVPKGGSEDGAAGIRPQVELVHKSFTKILEAAGHSVAHHLHSDPALQLEDWEILGPLRNGGRYAASRELLFKSVFIVVEVTGVWLERDSASSGSVDGVPDAAKLFARMKDEKLTVFLKGKEAEHMTALTDIGGAFGIFYTARYILEDLKYLVRAEACNVFHIEVANTRQPRWPEWRNISRLSISSGRTTWLPCLTQHPTCLR